MEITCPFCGTKKFHDDLQTKGLSCELNTYKAGDTLMYDPEASDYNEPIEVILECNSDLCMQYMKENDFDPTQSRAIYMQLEVRNGILTGFSFYDEQ